MFGEVPEDFAPPGIPGVRRALVAAAEIQDILARRGHALPQEVALDIVAKAHEAADWPTYRARLLWIDANDELPQGWLDAIEAPPTVPVYVRWFEESGRRKAVDTWARDEANDDEYRDIAENLAAQVAFLSGLFPHWTAFVAYARRRLSLKDWPRDVPQPSWGDEEPDWGDSSAAPPAK